MPTGYTADLYEGNDQSMETFVLRCARVMGACILQRDNPFDDLPALSAPSDYHLNQIRDAERELSRLNALTVDDAAAEAREERRLAIEERISLDKKALELRERYLAMLHQVYGWQPPTPDHAGLKDFMIEQLKTSMDHDCWTGYPDIPPVTSGEAWLQQKKEDLIKDVAYHTKENQNEVDRTRSRNRWITELYKSLGMESPEISKRVYRVNYGPGPQTQERRSLMFQEIIDELDGRRVISRGDGSYIVHYGDLSDDDDPRWFVTDRETLQGLSHDATQALQSE